MRLAWLVVALLGSSCANDAASSHAPARRDSKPSVAKPGHGSIRVGNQAKGVESQPDYDREAEQIRAQVAGKLPEPLPSPRGACNTMFDAAIAAYRRTDGPAARSVELLEATRADDLEACERETSAAAAACVAVLITQDGGEFPWLLDQCSRAFPS